MRQLAHNKRPPRLASVVVSVIAAVAVAGGCETTRPPDADATYVAARREQVTTAPAAVETPAATPRLRPLANTRPTTAPAVSPEQAIADAGRRATQRPTPEGFVEAVQTYAYVPGDVYAVVTSPGHVTTLMLRPGESLTATVAGDTAQWLVADAHAGGGASADEGGGTAARTLVLVKPLRPGIETNLVLATDQRVYQIDLRSEPAAYQSAVRWSYPADFITAHANGGESSAAGAEPPFDPAVRLADLDFGYRVVPDDTDRPPDWTPLRAFTDGRKTYVVFPLDLATMNAPPLFVLGRRGEAQLVNYRVRGRYYVVDAVLRKAQLRLGEAPQRVVTIERTDQR